MNYLRKIYRSLLRKPEPAAVYLRRMAAYWTLERRRSLMDSQGIDWRRL